MSDLSACDAENTFIRCRLGSTSLSRWSWRRITWCSWWRHFCTVVLAETSWWMSIYHWLLLLHIADAAYWFSLSVCNPASVFRATHTCQFVLNFFRIGSYFYCSTLLQRFARWISTFIHATTTSTYFCCINAQCNRTTTISCISFELTSYKKNHYINSTKCQHIAPKYRCNLSVNQYDSMKQQNYKNVYNLLFCPSSHSVSIILQNVVDGFHEMCAVRVCLSIR